MPERLQKILSNCSVASRREAEAMILAGRVAVGGVPATVGQSAELGRDEITVDGVPIAEPAKSVYIMLNKPPGYVTTLSDERGRKTVAQLVADAGARVYPVGRLDMYSEGLLLLTNDGAFAHAAMHPSQGKTKTYEVRVKGDTTDAERLLMQPMMLDSRTVQAVSAQIIEHAGGEAVLRIAVREGRNRQIRRMCTACGLSVLSLRRVSFGAVELGDLKPGQWRYLTDEERKSLCNNG
jgi:23S rRNA pseudouridine2605 synthase